MLAFSGLGIYLDEAIYYAESRFTTILIFLSKKTNKRDLDKNVWIQRLLKKELVSTYSLVFIFIFRAIINFI